MLDAAASLHICMLAVSCGLTDIILWMCADRDFVRPWR